MIATWSRQVTYALSNLLGAIKADEISPLEIMRPFVLPRKARDLLSTATCTGYPVG